MGFVVMQGEVKTFAGRLEKRWENVENHLKFES